MKDAKFRYLLLLSTLLCVLVWLAVFSIPDQNLHIVACDVGQGDGILITFGNLQILTDGGLPDNKILLCLSKHMPFWDRKIELVILTHPQLDHFGGLTEVFRRYKVDTFVANQVDASTSEYQVLKNVVGGQGVRVVNPQRGMQLRYKSLYLDILNPDTDLYEQSTVIDKSKLLGAYETKKDLNDFSVVDLLRFGNFSAIFTGDIGPARIPDILRLNQISEVDYLKVPHHGSKNGLTEDFLKVLSPEIAVISVGTKNRYGHPSKEITDLLAKYNILTKRTDEEGDVEVISDGKKWWLKL